MISCVFSRSWRSGSRHATKPPMFTEASFLALISATSASASCARAISATERSACPGSRSLMNHAFSAKRAMSSTSPLPRLRASTAASVRFSERDGLAAARVVRDRDEDERDARTFGPVEQRLEPVEVDVALERVRAARVGGLGHERSSARAPASSACARVVSKNAFEGTIAPASSAVRKNTCSAPRPWCVGRTWGMPSTLSTAAQKASYERAGIRLVAAHERGPLVLAHRACARVGEQVDQHVLGPDREDVVARVLEDRAPLLPRGHGDRLPGADPVRLGRRTHRHRGPSVAEPGPTRMVRIAQPVPGTPPGSIRHSGEMASSCTVLAPLREHGAASGEPADDRARRRGRVWDAGRRVRGRDGEALVLQRRSRSRGDRRRGARADAELAAYQTFERFTSPTGRARRARRGARTCRRRGVFFTSGGRSPWTPPRSSRAPTGPRPASRTRTSSSRGGSPTTARTRTARRSAASRRSATATGRSSPTSSRCPGTTRPRSRGDRPPRPRPRRGVLREPMIGAGGVLIRPRRLPRRGRGDLPRARRAPRRGRGDHRVRPARGVVRERALGLAPDIMTVAKGISSGYVPLGAVIVGERVRSPSGAPDGRGRSPRRHLPGHPTACVVGLRNLDILERERLVERVASSSRS